MFAKIIKFLFHFIVYAVFFLGLAYLLLGISPQESIARMKTQFHRFTNTSSRISSAVSKTAGDMKDAADSQLQQASDRLHGHDPYERIAQRYDADVANR